MKHIDLGALGMGLFLLSLVVFVAYKVLVILF